jgi:hypothetical protein
MMLRSTHHFGLFVLVASLWACSTRFKDPRAGDPDNVYFQYWRAHTPDSTPTPGPVDLFQVSEPLFWTRVADWSINDGRLALFPQRLLNPSLGPVGRTFPFDGGQGPGWIDLVHAEIESLLVAEERGFRGFQPGACLNGFEDGLKSNNSNIKNISPTELATEKTPANVFQKTFPSPPNSVIQLGLETKRSIQKRDELYNGVRIQLDDGFQIDVLRTQRSRCSDFIQLSEALVPHEKRACIVWNEMDWALLPAQAKISVASFATAALLQTKTYEQCWQWSQTLQRLVSRADLQTTLLALSGNPNLRKKLLNLAIEETEKVRSGSRTQREPK